MRSDKRGVSIQGKADGSGRVTNVDPDAEPEDGGKDREGGGPGGGKPVIPR